MKNSKNAEQESKLQDLLSEIYYRSASEITNEHLANLYALGLQTKTLTKTSPVFAGKEITDFLLTQAKFEMATVISAGLLKELPDGKLISPFENKLIFANSTKGEFDSLVGIDLRPDKLDEIVFTKGMRLLFGESEDTGNDLLLTKHPLVKLLLQQYDFNSYAFYDETFYDGETAKRIESKYKNIYFCLSDTSELSASLLRIAQKSSGKYKTLKLTSIPKLNLYLSDFPGQKLLDNAQNISGPDSNNASSNSEEGSSESNEEASSSKSSNKRSKTKKTYSAKFPGLVDIVDYEDEPNYCLVDDGKVIFKKECTIGSTIYVVPPRPSIPWLLPRGLQVERYYDEYLTGNEEEINQNLLDDLTLFFESVVELDDSSLFGVLGVWSTHTFFQEYFEFTPFISLVGPPETGKTRLGKGLLYTSFRPYYSESFRESFVQRLGNNFSSSIYFDMVDVSGNAIKTNAVDLINSRHAKGVQIAKTNYIERGAFRDTDFFDPFGPSILSSNHEIDPILMTRCLSIRTKETERIFQNDVTEISALSLRERLTALRAKYFMEKFPQVEKTIPGRIGDITLPLLKVARKFFPNSGAEEKIYNYANELSQRIRVQKSDPVEHQLIRAIYLLRNSVQGGKLGIESIAHEFNVRLDARLHLTNSSIGKTLRKLNFTGTDMGNGRRGIQYDQVLVESWIHIFGMDDLLNHNQSE